MVYLKIQFQYLLFLLLICDNFCDFGNLGIILRFVVGVGCSKVLFIKGCVDFWEFKVFWVGMGVYFQVFIINNLEWEIVFNYLFFDIWVYVVDNCGFCVQVQMFNKVSDYGWVFN